MYVRKTLSAAVCSRHEIVLNVASSGIAALLLSGGRTSHSQFHIPIYITEDSMCSISADSDLAGLLRKTKLIIWDEAPMINRHCFEAFERTLRDILRANDMNNANKLFGGIVIVFGGDFRQILPVMPRGGRQDIVNASINSSNLWKHCIVLKLTVNMRLSAGSSNVELEKTKEFAYWILRIGNGNVSEPNDGEATMEIPKDILLPEADDPLKSMIDTIYDQLETSLSKARYFEEKAILAPTNEVVKKINDKVMEMLPGEEKVYLSSDSICKQDNPSNSNLDLYTPDFLNKVELSGLPNHKLCLKVGVPVMLLRNVDQTAGLCNGTRLLVRRLGKHVIEVSIITGTNIGNVHFIPRMPLTSSDKRMPVKFQRRQFPVALCFAMTINKSQGQSLSKVGIYLEKPVFTHGQLYVALSRVKSKDGIKIFIADNEGKRSRYTTNVVYKEVLQKV
uniref:ATP-dependent DNA helicase PIF1-like n=1 Tax=Erigeron canadensis TaxID=72917 RepID=UPI001CB8CC17|nr:ATP-dependent DNA helicase PIF1-like [Erigeron canadensis]